MALICQKPLIQVNHLKNFLRNSSLNSFLLKATSENEVHKLISQNKGKALGPLSIPVTILKDNVNILSTPLSFIINWSFEPVFFLNL